MLRVHAQPTLLCKEMPHFCYKFCSVATDPGIGSYQKSALTEILGITPAEHKRFLATCHAVSFMTTVRLKTGKEDSKIPAAGIASAHASPVR
jgi:hypothetical protein